MSETPLEACRRAADRMIELSDLNQEIIEENNEKDRKYSDLRKEWKRDYNKAKNALDVLYSGSRGHYGKQVTKNNDCTAWSRSASSLHSDCANKYGNGWKADETWTYDGDACYGLYVVKYKCIKSSDQIAKEQRIKDDAYKNLKKSKKGQRVFGDPEDYRPTKFKHEDTHDLGNIICQDCSNEFNVIGSDTTTANVSQINKCIASIEENQMTEDLKVSGEDAKDNELESEFSDMYNVTATPLPQGLTKNMRTIIIIVIIIMLIFSLYIIFM